MALTKTAQYYLARYELVFSHRGFVDGASYTDVKAQLPALNLLMIISIAAAGLFIANIFRRGWVFPIIAVGLWGFISLVVGTIYPAVVQRFSVQPNELTKESEYIDRNIQATRTAFGSRQRSPSRTSTTRRISIPPTSAPTSRRSTTRACGARASWARSSRRRRRSRPSTSSTTSTSSATRSAKTNHLRSSRHVSSTPTTSPTERGRTDISSTPPGTARSLRSATSNAKANRTICCRTSRPPAELAPKLEQPRVYFGQGSTGTSSSTSKLSEQGCTEEGDTEVQPYQGDAGVSSSSFLRKVAFGLRFNDWNLCRLRAADRRFAHPLQPRHPRASAHRRAVPEIRRRSVSRRHRRQLALGHRRVHDVDALSVLTVAASRATCRRAAVSTPTSTTCGTR